MKRLRVPYLAWLITGVMSATLLLACQNDEEEVGGSVNVGDRVPAFVLQAADGTQLSSSSLAGQTILLTFFDTECPDCQKEFPVLQRIYEKYGRDVAVLNVPRSQSIAEVQNYWEQTGLTMPFHLPADKNLYWQFATRGIPRTYVINPSGVVCAVFTDAPLADYDQLDAALYAVVGEPHPLSADSVNVKFKIKRPALEVPNDSYFKNEYNVSYLEVWFFDVRSGELAEKVVINNPKPAAYTILPYDITYVTEQQRIHVGMYNIFAIANYRNVPDSLHRQDEFLSLIDSVTYQAGIEAYIPDQGPVMTNRATSLMWTDMLSYAGKDYFLTIDLERVLAKVQIGVSKNSFELKHDGRKYADINITNYKLVNLNTQYYLFQHQDNVTTLGEQPEFQLPNHFADNSEADDQYVVDPFFYQKTGDLNEAAKFKDIYKRWFGAFTLDSMTSMPTANNYGYAYILENTAFKDYQKNGYSPGIVYQAAVNPVFVYLYDYDNRTLKEEYRPEFWQDRIYLYKYNFYGSLRALNHASGLSLDELATYTDEQLRPYGIKQCVFNGGTYETYYTYWIQHRGGGAEGMEYMKYGIVRNNFYRVVIAGVSGLGHSMITPDIMQNDYPNSYLDVVVD